MFCFCPDCIIDLSNLRIIEIPNYSFGESWFGLFVAIEHAAGMSLRFDGNLGGAFIWVVFKLVVDVCGVVDGVK